MRRRRQPQFKRLIISNPEDTSYLKVDKKSRIANLYKDVELGDKAKIAKEFLEAYMDTVEDDVLLALKEGKKDSKMVQLYYTVALDFQQMIERFIRNGEVKNNTINRLKKEIVKENKRSE